jgi:hypothetical protein
MKSAGYSGTPLAKKLGIKEYFKIKLLNQPPYYLSLFSDWPANVQEINDVKIKKNLIHFFVTEIRQLQGKITQLKGEIEPNGCIWISWPKKAAKVVSNVSEGDVRHIALTNGLVDIKVCAVDEVWSGLKLVIPVKDR